MNSLLATGIILSVFTLIQGGTLHVLQGQNITYMNITKKDLSNDYFRNFNKTKHERVFFLRHGLCDPERLRYTSDAAVWNTFRQPLDHFDSENKNYWNMRFVSNEEFYEPGGPVFIMLGGEWAIDETWVLSGQMYDMAKSHKGLLFYLEHRFYGESLPTKDFSVESLKYLTTAQALEDFAAFCKYLKSMKNLLKAKIVVFGGSYGGNLAMWMRQKYPTLVHAAVSSSAPLLAKVDFYEYFQVVRNSLGPSCSDIIKRAIDTTLKIIQTSEGPRRMQQDFNLCEALNVENPIHVAYFFLMVISTFGQNVQYADKTTLPDICNSISSPSWASEYARVAMYVRSQHNTCVFSYNDFIKLYQDTSLSTGNTRPWIYQTCTQYGYFQTTTYSDQPFGNTIPIDLQYSWCRDILGEEFTPKVVHDGVAQTNILYGGLHPNTSRVVSIHGGIDPWHALGLSTSPGPGLPVIIVKGGSHTADLNSISPKDSPEMIEAKLAVQNYTETWLIEPADAESSSKNVGTTFRLDIVLNCVIFVCILDYLF